MAKVNLHSAPMLRFWTERGLLAPSACSRDLGARLGDWLSVRHAIQLHQLIDASKTQRSTVSAPRAEKLRAELDQMVKHLQAAILKDRFVSGLWRNPMPAAMLMHPLVWDELWEPYRRYLSDHQKQMGLWLGRWRKKARSELAAAAGELQVLANLDAVYDAALSDKETRLLSTLPARMGRHLARLVDQHRPTEPVNGDQPSASSPVWLREFEGELRVSLMAELELRLQPLLGLIEAMESKCK